MNTLIEKLKDKNYVRAFGIMTPEQQECFRKVGIKNCIIYGGDKARSKLEIFVRF